MICWIIPFALSRVGSYTTILLSSLHFHTWKLCFVAVNMLLNERTQGRCFKDSFDSLIISEKLCHFVTLMERICRNSTNDPAIHFPYDKKSPTQMTTAYHMFHTMPHRLTTSLVSRTSEPSSVVIFEYHMQPVDVDSVRIMCTLCFNFW